jgi:predicted nucleic acid-binding protein
VNDVAYIDASAMVKLVVSEPQSEALAAAIDLEWPYLAASEILAVETSRAVSRVGDIPRGLISRRLQSVALLPLTAEIRKTAARVGPVGLRTLDAIHLATALAASDRIGAVLTYDARLSDACAAVGLPVVAPA